MFEFIKKFFTKEEEKVKEIKPVPMVEDHITDFQERYKKQAELDSLR